MRGYLAKLDALGFEYYDWEDFDWKWHKVVFHVDGGHIDDSGLLIWAEKSSRHLNTDEKLTQHIAQLRTLVENDFPVWERPEAYTPGAEAASTLLEELKAKAADAGLTFSDCERSEIDGTGWTAAVTLHRSDGIFEETNLDLSDPDAARLDIAEAMDRFAIWDLNCIRDRNAEEAGFEWEIVEEYYDDDIPSLAWCVLVAPDGRELILEIDQLDDSDDLTFEISHFDDWYAQQEGREAAQLAE